MCSVCEQPNNAMKAAASPPRYQHTASLPANLQNAVGVVHAIDPAPPKPSAIS